MLLLARIHLDYRTTLISTFVLGLELALLGGPGPGPGPVDGRYVHSTESLVELA
jgi:hypothetical protein